MNKKEIMYDILKELFNISVGKAACILSEIIDRKIILKVPDIEIVNYQKEDFKLDNYLANVIDGALIVSSITFNQDLSGKANLIFPANKMRKFINLCLNNELNEEDHNQDFTDIDLDVIKEIGNIILNSLVGEISNFLEITLIFSLPEVRIFTRGDFKNDIGNKTGYKYVVILYINFTIDNTEIIGAIIIDLNLKSLHQIVKKFYGMDFNGYICE